MFNFELLSCVATMLFFPLLSLSSTSSNLLAWQQIETAITHGYTCPYYHRFSPLVRLLLTSNHSSVNIINYNLNMSKA